MSRRSHGPPLRGHELHARPADRRHLRQRHGARRSRSTARTSCPPRAWPPRRAHVADERRHGIEPLLAQEGRVLQLGIDADVRARARAPALRRTSGFPPGRRYAVFAGRSCGRRSLQRSVFSSASVKSSTHQPVRARRHRLSSPCADRRTPARSATSVVPEISFSCRQTSTPSCVITRSGSMKSAPCCDREAVRRQRVLGPFAAGAAVRDHDRAGARSDHSCSRIPASASAPASTVAPPHTRSSCGASFVSREPHEQDRRRRTEASSAEGGVERRIEVRKHAREFVHDEALEQQGRATQCRWPPPPSSPRASFSSFKQHERKQSRRRSARR